ncbi:FAD-binding protein [Natronobacterium gregoryi]|uniref:FAD-dependent pyridine nucleotide-disulfide oxidoreductase n=2 Tax=Natronobacterium gregoryi TaxID=44930 RepID=L0AFY2_NATGS|nr:FAD-binding protein [Natronobacterium gregoryi]AFZ72057.1 thioredoxin reductase [Natronobacterium gregoryi SP2]ELY62771.1 FAD-dependent pyridine nucleotide-disulfide oxidoreductase [Natronobacterium gregoryi SP2]PLK20905.1 NAD(P)/FAD-dependent oxidoreductase [Natronobacterium gregoryi SP2]SFJ44840.1 FAD binding domain-containing protein [Natronobacterium gregoryi]
MRDVCLVGGGVAGLAASIFTARAGLETLVVDDDRESILTRNASLENYPGFPYGVDARRYLQLSREQAEIAGAKFEDGRITCVEPLDEANLENGFLLETASGEEIEARRVVAASWPDSEYLGSLGVDRKQRGSKHHVAVGDGGRTAVDGVYAAGRIAGEPHQAIVAAGHGAKVGLAVIHDSAVNFYHDWVVPEGYFTGRERAVPPCCEEIDDDERRERDERARARLLEAFEAPLDEQPRLHPAVEMADE